MRVAAILIAAGWVISERAAGIGAGYGFYPPLSERVVFYVDLGVSGGMARAARRQSLYSRAPRRA